MMRKRGISPVVATIAITLLTLGAVSFIAGFLVPYVKNQLSEGTECVDYREYLRFDDSFGFNCYEVAGSQYLVGISVRAESAPARVSSGLKQIDLSFYDASGSNRVSVIEGAAPSLTSGGLMMLQNDTRNLEIPESGGARTYVYTSDSQINRVEVFPVLKEKDRLCDASDEVDIDILCTPIGALSS